LIWFVLVSLFDIISLSIMGWLIYRSQGLPNFVRYFDIGIGKKLLKDSWPLLLSSIAISIYMRIDQVMIKNMLGDREVGLYSAAMRLVEVWYFIPMIITQSVFPAIVNAKKISEELYYKRLQQLFSFLVMINVLIIILIAIFSKKIVHILYGDKFIEASDVLQIAVWSTVFVSLFVASGSWLINENYTTIALYRNLSAAIVNVMLNIFLINYYGIKGAAYAYLLSFFISGFLFDLHHHKTRSIFFIKVRALNVIGAIMYEKNRNF